MNEKCHIEVHTVSNTLAMMIVAVISAVIGAAGMWLIMIFK